MAWRGLGLVLALAALTRPSATARAAEPIAEPAAAAQAPAENAVYVEAFGSGMVPSVNYARHVGDVIVRGGLGYWRGSESSTSGSTRYSYASVPLTGAAPIGHGPLRLEIGGGITFLHMTFAGDGTTAGLPGLRVADSVSAWLPMVTAMFGVRYAPPGAGLTAALTFTPVLAVLANAEVIGAERGTTVAFLPWGGASIGYQF
jgi:hypothetical protein